MHDFFLVVGGKEGVSREMDKRQMVLLKFTFIVVAELFPPGVRTKSEGVRACLHGSG